MELSLPGEEGWEYPPATQLGLHAKQQSQGIHGMAYSAILYSMAPEQAFWGNQLTCR